MVNEVCMWRSIIRKSGMLQRNRFNIYGEALTSDMDDLTVNLNRKMREYWDQVQSGTSPHHVKLDVLYVTPTSTPEDLAWDANGEDDANEY